MAALVIIIFFIPYTASGFSACGKLFSTLFGMDYLTAMLISAAVIVIYTVMGGFLAASFTDLIQSIIMTVALVVVLGFGAAFGPVMLMALFWKRSNKWGALAGMVVGGVMVFVWKFLISPLGGVWAIYELLPAFLCSLVAIVVVSLLTPAPEQSVVQIFEEIKKK